jgi:hypothetical protein
MCSTHNTNGYSTEMVDVFLKKEEDTFCEKMEFMNPVFHPQEQRMEEYGYMDSYSAKYKWNGFKIDTIEYNLREDYLK